MSYKVQLSETELNRYKEKGYLVPDFRLPRTVVLEMKNEYEALIKNNPGISPDFMLGPHLDKPGTQGVKGNRKWFEFATRTELMDIAAQLIGDDIILSGTTIFGKPAQSGKETPWHQDGDFYPIRPLETLTIWIALDDVTPDNCRLILSAPTAVEIARALILRWFRGDLK